MLAKVFLLTIALAHGACQTYNPPCSPTVSDNCNCRPDYARCYWWGDPHYRTFDGLEHHFQGIQRGIYKYVTPCTGDFNLVPFQILGAHRACPSTRWLCTWYVSIRLYDSTGRHERTVTMHSRGVYDTRLRSNVAPNIRYYYTATSYYMYTVTGSTRELYVYTGRLCNGDRYDFKVTDNTYMTRVSVDLNEYYEYLVCGLCGFYSGNPSDDFIKGVPTNTCPQLPANIPRYMHWYSTANWNLVREFGESWNDNPRVRRLMDGPTPSPALPVFDENELSNAKNLADNLFLDPFPVERLVLPGEDPPVDDFLEKCGTEVVIQCPNLETDCILGCCQPICTGNRECPGADAVRTFVEKYIPLPAGDPPKETPEPEPVEEWTPDFR